MSRRDYTNQHGVFVPTESEAINNIDHPVKKKNEEEIVVKKHRSVLREDDMNELDKNRKRFTDWVKEEIEKEENMPTVYENELKEQAEAYNTLRRAYQRAYYQEHKEQYRENQKRYREAHREKCREYQRQYYANRNKGKRNGNDASNYNPETGHSYVDLDKIRLVKDGNKIVGWYRPDGWLE